MLLGFDPGNGEAKFVHNGGARITKISFRSMVGEAPAPRVAGRKMKNIGSNTYRVGNLLVGDYADMQTSMSRATRSDERWRDAEFIKALFFTGLGIISSRTGQTHFQVVTGLPFTHFNETSAQARRILNGQHKFIMDDKEYAVEVDCAPVNVGIVPSAVGAWANYAVDENGEIVKTNPKTIILDVGTGTTELAQVVWDERAGAPTLIYTKSRSIVKAWATVVNYVAERAIEAGAQDLKFSEVDKAIVAHRSIGTIEIAEWANEAIENLAYSIKSEFNDLYAQALDAEAVVVCGGPAPTIFPYLQSAINHPGMVLSNDSQFATCRGYFAWAKGVAYGTETQ